MTLDRRGFIKSSSLVVAGTSAGLLSHAAASDSRPVEGARANHESNRQRMIDSLSYATRYILNCKNTNPNSPTFGGYFVLYDLAARTRLRSDWPWSWGPSGQTC